MKFLQTIDNSFLGRIAEKKLSLIQSLDPNRFYVENIRSFFNIPHFLAKILCEMAVKDNLFIKKVGVKCPNDSCGRMITSETDLNKLPSIVVCHNCELLEKDNFEFNLSDCSTIEFYKLNDNR